MNACRDSAIVAPGWGILFGGGIAASASTLPSAVSPRAAWSKTKDVSASFIFRNFSVFATKSLSQFNSTSTAVPPSSL